MKSNFEQQLSNLINQRVLTPPDQEQTTTLFEEPLPGHEERFEMRLLQKREVQKMKRLPRWPWVLLAAATVAGIIVFVAISEVKETQEIAKNMKLSDVSQEMAIVEKFYSDRLSLDFNKINQEDMRIQKFMLDIKNLEIEYETLEKQLISNYNNQRLINAMVSNYKYRLRTLEHLQKYIELQNEIQNKTNETQPIS